MNVVALLISVALNGLLIGAIGRLLLPGRDPMGLLATMGVGIAASLGGGLLAYAIAGEDAWALGLGLSLAMAMAFVMLVRSAKGGRDERPPGLGPPA
ncbi:MAG: GlsB/YeaQ/YmgE family stress response membrane protein [Actinomycetota bacterium]